MTRKVFLVALFLILGCSRPAEKKVFDFQEAADKIEKVEAASEAANKKLLARLKNDPQPIFDFAVKTLKETLPEHVGDTNAMSAVITVDRGSLKTFGEGKWRVRGGLKVKDEDDRMRETIWQMTINSASGKLYCEASQLDVR